MESLRRISPHEWPSIQDPVGYHCLYVVSDADGVTKIGHASHPARRLSALQCGNSRPLTMMAVFAGDRATCLSVEKELHGKIEHLRCTGEWFQIEAVTAISIVTNIIRERIIQGASK